MSIVFITTHSLGTLKKTYDFSSTSESRSRGIKNVNEQIGAAVSHRNATQFFAIVHHIWTFLVPRKYANEISAHSLFQKS
jgi:hypothetical protein